MQSPEPVIPGIDSLHGGGAPMTYLPSIRPDLKGSLTLDHHTEAHSSGTEYLGPSIQNHSQALPCHGRLRKVKSFLSVITKRESEIQIMRRI